MILAIILGVSVPIILGVIIFSHKPYNLVSGLEIASDDPRSRRLRTNLDFTGLVQKGAQKKCEGTSGKFCYKLYPSDGSKYIWIKPGASVQTEFKFKDCQNSEKNCVPGKRVSIVANELEAIDVGNDDGEGKIYYTIKEMTLAPFDYTVKFGTGAGEDFRDIYPDLKEIGAKFSNPGIWWMPFTQTLSDDTKKYVSDSLDKSLETCQTFGMTCGIFFGGMPDFAVQKGIAKAGQSNGLWPTNCYDKINFPFPPDDDKYDELANYISYIAERYDGDTEGGNYDPNGNPKAAYITLFNESDINQGTKTANGTNICGNPAFATDPDLKDKFNSDLNNNGKADVDDYSDMMYTIHKKLQDSHAGVPLATSRFAINNDIGRKFVQRFLSNQMVNGVVTKPAFDVMAMHFYEDQPGGYTFWDNNTPDTFGRSQLRGKLNWIKNQMQANGGVKPVVFTEFGWPAPNSEDKKHSDVLAKLLTRAFSKDLTQGLIQFKLHSSAGFPTSGLVNLDGTKRPAYYTFKTLQNELGGTKFLTIDYTNPDYIEGYVYVTPEQKKKEVVWYNKKTPTQPDQEVSLIFKTDSLTVTELNGLETPPTQTLRPLSGSKTITVKLNKDKHPLLIQYY